MMETASYYHLLVGNKSLGQPDSKEGAHIGLNTRSQRLLRVILESLPMGDSFFEGVVLNPEFS